MQDDVDILVITYNRPHYARRALGRLVETLDDRCRLWLWHNGTDEETLAVHEAFRDRAFAHHHSPQNQRLVAPTNWLWSRARGRFVSKVDDDCLLPDGWIDALRAAHAVAPQLGAVGCWRFQPEDLLEEVAARKTVDLVPGRGDGPRLYRSCWVQGSGYLLKRECVERQGLLGERGNPESWTHYCVHLALRGWQHGFVVPFVHEDHMDDPRSPNSALRSDADLAEHLPLSALRAGITDLESWTRQVVRNARETQTAPLDPRAFVGWRRKLRSVWRRLRRTLAGA